MNLVNFNPDSLVAPNAFAWRYMDYRKISDLITNKTVYFARLDTFCDPIEGLPLEQRANLQNRNILKCELPETEYLKVTTKLPKLNISDIEKWQHGTFCSCWYLTEDTTNKTSNHHESLAMWNFFEDYEAFLLKLNFADLLSGLSEALKGTEDQEIFAAKYGKVHYLNYGEYFRLLNSSDQDFMPSLFKHNSYRFENEFRFLLLRNKIADINENRIGIKVSLPRTFDFQNCYAEIIAHPKLTEEKFKSYSAKFKSLGFDLKVSSIVTRERVVQLLD